MDCIKLILPDGFLNEEIRCDYVVTNKMKAIWAVELDLLTELQRVCNKYNLKYYADGGTLLGAVRHRGFIPWDDDIDIMMPREDYSKLCKIAKEEFYEPYFFQINETDPGSSHGHAQLRNSMTTAILGGRDKFSNHNQGIFIDVFPVDVIPDNKFLRHFHRFLINFFLMNYYFWGNCSVNYNQADKRGKWRLRSFLNKNFYRLNFFIMNYSYNLYEKVCSLCNSSNSNFYSKMYFGYDQYIYDLNKYEKTIYLQFEFLNIPAPFLYEDVLDKYFGDWKKYVKGTSLHGNVFYDTNKSYRDYL